MISETKGQKKIFRLKHKRQRDGKYKTRECKRHMVFQNNVWSPRGEERENSSKVILKK